MFWSALATAPSWNLSSGYGSLYYQQNLLINLQLTKTSQEGGKLRFFNFCMGYLVTKRIRLHPDTPPSPPLWYIWRWTLLFSQKGLSGDSETLHAVLSYQKNTPPWPPLWYIWGWTLQVNPQCTEEFFSLFIGSLHHWQVGHLGQEGRCHHLQYQHRHQVETHDHWEFTPSIANCITVVI